MMRVTRQQDGETITLKIEGCLAGEWANEMKRCWDEVKDDTRPRVIRIDLTGVTFIDAAGRELLAQMLASGVITGAANVMTKAVVERLTCDAQVNQPGRSETREDLEHSTKRS